MTAFNQQMFIIYPNVYYRKHRLLFSKVNISEYDQKFNGKPMMLCASSFKRICFHIFTKGLCVEKEIDWWQQQEKNREMVGQSLVTLWP